MLQVIPRKWLSHTLDVVQKYDGVWVDDMPKCGEYSSWENEEMDETLEQTLIPNLELLSPLELIMQRRKEG